MEHWTSHLRPDGTTFPPVTPDPPPPPGYVDPIAGLEDTLRPYRAARDDGKPGRSREGADADVGEP